MSYLTGNETWIVEANKGAVIWAQAWGDSGDKWWWPICDIELDCGLIGIDVCGMREVWDLGECARLRIEHETIIENEDIYNQ